MRFQVQTQVRLPKDAGDGGHHPRRSDGKPIYEVGATVFGEEIEPRVLEELIEKGTLKEVTVAEASDAMARRLAEEARARDAAALKAAAEEERAKAEAAKAQKGGKR